MSNDFIQYAFVAGEISPRLWGRTDFEKYDLGLAEGKNWFVDYRGGLTTRPGFYFQEPIPQETHKARLFKFQFSPDTSNTYAIVFNYDKIRFMQDGVYITEASKSVTAVSIADPGVFTSAGHGYANNDLVKLSGMTGEYAAFNNQTFLVNVLSANTFSLVWFPADGVSTLGFAAYGGGGTVARVFSVTNPYAEADLATIRAEQIRDVLRLTHKNYPIKNLTRLAHNNWTISNEVIGNGLARPSGLVSTKSGAAAAGVIFVVTAVDAEGNESLPSNPHFITSMVDYSTTSGWVQVRWSKVTNAVSYRIYRSLILADSGQLSHAMMVGFVGTSKAPLFLDNNIIPDFTVTPPANNNPFVPGQVIDAVVTNAGSGYADATTTVAASGGGGSGFVGYTTVAGGAVRDIIILNGGSGYTSAPTLTISGAGTLATATATIGPLTGVYPSVSARFQQRQIYAATENDPLGIWGSRPGQLSNFDSSDIVTDDVSYQFELDANSVAPIRHLIAMRGGLIVMSQSGVWQLTGDGGVVTPTNALADPQTYSGPAQVEPLLVNTDILYVTSKESTIQLLSYNDFSKIYGSQDMSILSSHLFSADNEIVRWTYTETPYRLVWAAQEKGTFRMFAIVKEQNVFAWTPGETRGYVKDFITLEQDNRDVTYAIVGRKINGITVLYVERVTNRDAEYAEDAFCVDCGLSLDGNYPAHNLTIPAATGDAVQVTASGIVFSPGCEGNVIRAGGGKMIITTRFNSTTVEVRIVRDIVDTFGDTGIPVPFPAGTWTYDTPVTEIGGLRHLEGEEVAILGDGNVFPRQTVTGGKITLPAGVTRCHVGLPFECVARLLPPVARDSIIEGRRKNVIGLATRRYLSRGIKYGPSRDKLYEVAERTNEVPGEPITLKTDNRYELLPHRWDENGQIYLIQDNPLPATILAVVPDLEIGDDKD